MKLLLPVLVMLLLNACATKTKNKDEDEVIMIGTPIPRSQLKESNLVEVKPLEGESILDMMLRLQGVKSLPKPEEFKNCEELLQQLKQKKIEPTLIEKHLVVVKTPTGSFFSYELNDSSCIQ